MKTSELTGAALDWAVAKCLTLAEDARGFAVRDGFPEVLNETWQQAQASHNWAQGGPIIEREELTLSYSPYDHVFYGRTRPWCAEKKGRMEYGPTPLIAAMRCYVAGKLGDEIKLPEELK